MAGLNLFTNNAATTLASSINNSVTSLTVASGTGALFPTLAGSQYFYCTLANTAGTVEIVKVTARSTDTFTIVRGQDNTSATSWNAGDKVELRLVNADLINFPQLDSNNTFAGTQTLSGLTASKTVFTDASKNLTTTGTVGVDQGGTGQTSYTDGQLLIGNSTGNTLAKGTLTAGSGISVTNGPGAAITIASTVTSGQLKTEIFTSPGTWTKPSAATQVKVLVVAGGGGGGGGSPTAGPGAGSAGGRGGYGGIAYASNIPVSAPVTVTVGSGGNGGNAATPGVAGGTSSFGPAISATGGGFGGGGGPTPTSTGATGANGSGTVSLGTALRTFGLTTPSDGNQYVAGFMSGNTSSSPETYPSPTSSTTATTWSTSSPFIGGNAGANGAQGTFPLGAGFRGGGGVSGFVVVEYVG